jgi:hypothetical protein
MAEVYQISDIMSRKKQEFCDGRYEVFEDAAGAGAG